MAELIGAVFLLAGAGFVLIAAIGLLRFPDVLTRMHATTKSGTLGVGLIAVSAMFFFGEVAIVTRAAGIILFVFLTAPVAAHMISRAAYFADVQLWEGTFVDQLREDRHRSEIIRSESRPGTEDLD